MPRTLASLALVLLATAPSPAAAGARAGSCATSEGRTIAADPAHRVFSRGSGDRGRLYACRRGSRPRLIARAYGDGYVESGRFTRVSLAGRHVAFVFVAKDLSCKAACPEDFDPVTEGLRIVDLSTGRVRAVAGFTGRDYVLTGTGALAWIAPLAGGGRRIVADVRGERRVLAEGPGIEAGSLEASATRVTWVRDGRLEAARL